jgi:hypothetical protein
MTAGGGLSAAAGAKFSARGFLLRLSRGGTIRSFRVARPAKGSRRADAAVHDLAAMSHLSGLAAIQAGTVPFGGSVLRWIDRL